MIKAEVYAKALSERIRLLGMNNEWEVRHSPITFDPIVRFKILLWPSEPVFVALPYFPAPYFYNMPVKASWVVEKVIAHVRKRDGIL